MLFLSGEDCKMCSMLNEKRCVCFVDLEKTFDRVPWKVLEWAVKEKEIPDAFD